MNLLEKTSSLLSGERYGLSFAQSESDIVSAQALRYEVFNRELGEGLLSSEESQRDMDAFDSVCDHLLVKDLRRDEVIGTYRMQTGKAALNNRGYYCAQEFNLDVFEPYRSETVELGRACIAKNHRSFQVLSILWRGIASYAQKHQARYLLGCSSLTSQSPAEGLAAYLAMQSSLSPSRFRTHPQLSHVCVVEGVRPTPIKIPKLLSTYLSLGAWICGPPAIDREFKTIDFLTLLDLQSDNLQARRRRFGVTN